MIRRPIGIIPKKPIKSKTHKNDLLRVDPSVLADQLSLLEYDLYGKITPLECLTYVRKQTGPDIQNLLSFCSTYDKLGSWVKMSILSMNAITKRGQTIDHWIKVAEVSRVPEFLYIAMVAQSRTEMSCQLQLRFHEFDHQRDIEHCYHPAHLHLDAHESQIAVGCAAQAQ